MSGGIQVTGVWRVALLASVAALFVIGQTDSADAQFFRQLTATPARHSIPPAIPRPARPIATTAQSKKDVPIRQPFGENMPKGPLQLMVSINEQRAVLYSNGVRVAETKVSTGTASHPTPTGVFSIIQKNRWHRSNLYGNAPMFYMHRLTWSGIALHEGHLPGFAASHGCIRMPTEFVSRLWNVSKHGHAGRGGARRTGAAGIRARQAVQPGAEAGRHAARPARRRWRPKVCVRRLTTTGQGPVRRRAGGDRRDRCRRRDRRAGRRRHCRGRSRQFSRQGAVATGAEASAIMPATRAATDVDDDGRAGTDRRGHRAGRQLLCPPRPPRLRPRRRFRLRRERAGHDLDRRSAAPRRGQRRRPAAATSEPERPAVDPNELSCRGRRRCAPAPPSRRSSTVRSPSSSAARRSGSSSATPSCRCSTCRSRSPTRASRSAPTPSPRWKSWTAARACAGTWSRCR